MADQAKESDMNKTVPATPTNENKNKNSPGGKKANSVANTGRSTALPTAPTNENTNKISPGLKKANSVANTGRSTATPNEKLRGSGMVGGNKAETKSSHKKPLSPEEQTADSKTHEKVKKKTSNISSPSTANMSEVPKSGRTHTDIKLSTPSKAAIKGVSKSSRQSAVTSPVSPVNDQASVLTVDPAHAPLTRPDDVEKQLLAKFIEETGPFYNKNEFKSFGKYQKEELNRLSYVSKLRGYSSDPCIVSTLEADQLPEFNKYIRDQKRNCHSLEDFILSETGYKDLLKGELNDANTRKYDVTKKTMSDWRKLYAVGKKKFSFFDELFAIGYVTDSMEVPGSPDDLTYLVEAEKSALRDKIDYGRVSLKTKHVYIGNFKDWYFDGPGRYTWTNGSTYQGDFKDGLMHGEGVLLWEDGSIYEGLFQNGVRFGWGVYSTVDGHTYAGDWHRGLPQGKGKMWYDPLNDEGDFYDGDWFEGKPHGHGARQYSNGDRYVGNWEQGVRTGKGTMTWLNERQVYKGDWLNGTPHGVGRHTWYITRTRNSNFPTRHVYQGDMENGVRHGIGRMVYPCGSVYEGRWRNGHRYGRGMFINPAGDLVVGLFQYGSLIGGDDVPLHKPSYECDFGALIEILYAKLKLQPELTTEMEVAEKKNLSGLTHAFLGQIKELYKRAGFLGEAWGNPGAHPSWLKAQISRGTKLRLQQRNKGEEKCKNCCSIDVDEIPTKASPDNLYPVTRFGLWLLLRDCPGILVETTLAEFDKLFNDILSISFQTCNNPFEPVYLWQFLQCIVAIAAINLVETPHKEELLTLNKEEELAVLGSSPPGPVRKRKVKRAGAEEFEGEEKEEIYTNRKNVGNMEKLDGMSGSPRATGGYTVPAPPPTPEIVRSPRNCKKRPTGSASGDTGNQRLSTLEGGGEGGDEYCSDDDSYWKHTPKVKAAESVQEIEIKLPIFDAHKNRIPRISQAFDTLLKNVLLPALHVQAGENLPPKATPLPSLADLHTVFTTTTGGKEIISAVEFLQHIFEHKLAVDHDPIYWTRTKEPLAPFLDSDAITILYEPMTDMKMHSLDEDDVEEETINFELGSDYLGEKFSNTGIFTKQMKKEVAMSDGPEGRRTSIHIYGLDNKVFGVDPPETTGESCFTKMNEESGECDEQTVVHENDDDCEDPKKPTLDPEVAIDPDLMDTTLFGERDLVSEPFLLIPESNSKVLQKRERVYPNVTTMDVIKVLRYLYPAICGPLDKINLEFDMTFGDWLFGISMVAKISSDREFYRALRKESPIEHKPFSSSTKRLSQQDLEEEIPLDNNNGDDQSGKSSLVKIPESRNSTDSHEPSSKTKAHKKLA